MSAGERSWEDARPIRQSTATAALNIGTVVTAVAPGWFFVGTLGLALHRQLGFGAFAIGMLAASASLGYVAVAMPAGRAVDRSGGNRMFTRAPFVVGVGFLIMTLMHSALELMVISAVLGGVYAAATAALNRYALMAAVSGRSGLTVGLVQASTMLVACLGALVIPWLASRHGWRSAVIALSVVCTLASILAAAKFRGSRAVPAPLSVARYEGARRLDRRFRALMVFGLSMGAAMTCTWTFLLPYLATTIGLSTTGAAIGLSLLFGAAIVGRLLGGVVLDRGVAASALLVAASVSGVCSFVVLALVHSGPLLYIAVGAIGILLLAHNTAFLLVGMRMVSRESWAFAGATLTVAHVGGGVVGPLAFAFFVERLGGYRASWLMLSATTLVGLVFLRYAFPRAEPVKGAV